VLDLENGMITPGYQRATTAKATRIQIVEFSSPKADSQKETSKGRKNKIIPA
jgi:hypothetical protein